MKIFTKFFKSLKYLFFGGGQKCICCGKEIFEDSENFCTSCKKNILKNEIFCSKCGMPTVSVTEYCSRCGGQSVHFESANSYFIYDKNCTQILYNYKMSCIKEVGERLSRYLCELWYRENLSIDFVTFVPSSKYALKRRRFDTSEFLAQYFCKSTSLQLVSTLDCLMGNEQKKLNRKERFASIKGKFAIKNKEIVDGKTILLIDDLMTTGATAIECSRILKKCKAKSVYVFTVFSVPQLFSEQKN